MRRLQKWLGRHKKVLIMVTLTALLSPLVLTACGSAESEDTERPKTPFELESMIQSSEADIQDIRGDIEGINTKLTLLQTTASHDWSAEITAIQSQLITITARLDSLVNPTPRPTTPGGLPLPTLPPQTGGLTVEILSVEPAVIVSKYLDVIITVRLRNDTGRGITATLTQWFNHFIGETKITSDAAVAVADASGNQLNPVPTNNVYFFGSKEKCSQVKTMIQYIPIADGQAPIIKIRTQWTQEDDFQWIPSFTITE